MNQFSYNYTDGYYDIPALHRKALTFDPRNTDNIIILDYFHDVENKRRKNNSNIYYKLISNDLDKYKEVQQPPFPISFQMIYHSINIAWLNIIYQMIFVDKAYSTFYGEYKDSVDSVLVYSTINDKESLVYRYFYTGESIFHIAGKIWMYEKYLDNEGVLITEKLKNLNTEFKHMLECYQGLENAMGKKHSIMYMTDFENVSLLDYLTNFLDDIRDNKFT